MTNLSQSQLKELTWLDDLTFKWILRVCWGMRMIIFGIFSESVEAISSLDYAASKDKFGE
jgi:hypothetical protein